MAIHGSGVYLTDIDPASAAGGDPLDMSQALFSTPFVTQKVTNFVAINVVGLPVIDTGPVYPNLVYGPTFSNYFYPGPMDVSGRIVGFGSVDYAYQTPPDEAAVHIQSSSSLCGTIVS